MVDSIETKVALVEQQTKTIMEQFNELKKDNIQQHNELFELINGMKSSIDTLPERLDGRYASKETEVALKRVTWIVITSLVMALVALVVKQ